MNACCEILQDLHAEHIRSVHACMEGVGCSLFTRVMDWSWSILNNSCIFTQLKTSLYVGLIVPEGQGLIQSINKLHISLKKQRLPIFYPFCRDTVVVVMPCILQYKDKGNSYLISVWAQFSSSSCWTSSWSDSIKKTQVNANDWMFVVLITYSVVWLSPHRPLQ